MDLSAIKEKEKNLIEYIKELGKVGVAFSSGVDSAYLLDVACEAVGMENVVAVTAKSASFPQREFKEAEEFCSNRGIKHIVVETDELKIEDFVKNPNNRCYICKKSLFQKLIMAAQNAGMKYLVEGSNVDDNSDYRPGMQAIKELDVKSPLRHAGLYKSEIRILSKERGLETANKPSFACLSSRIPYGETISREKLMIVEKAEQFLMDRGFEQLRVRLHGEKNYVVRIELLPQDMLKLMEPELRREVYDYCKELGVSYVSLDLIGYRTGSMNETLGVTIKNSMGDKGNGKDIVLRV